MNMHKNNTRSQARSNTIGVGLSRMSRRRREKELYTEYQRWIDKALDRRGINLTTLSEMVNADYSHIWRIARGDPAKYPNSARPGYELNELIGEALNDVSGAMLAAGYWRHRTGPHSDQSSIREDDDRSYLRQMEPGTMEASEIVPEEYFDANYELAGRLIDDSKNLEHNDLPSLRKRPGSAKTPPAPSPSEMQIIADSSFHEMYETYSDLGEADQSILLTMAKQLREADRKRGLGGGSRS